MDKIADALLVDRAAKTLRQLALEKLRGAIWDLKFQPGERLVERTLCEQLGVSRTVVREALRHLESEGLVVIVPGQGPAVAAPTLETIAQIYELRSMLEAMAAKHCAATATEHDIGKMSLALDAVRAGYAAHDPATVLAATANFYQTMFAAAERHVAWDLLVSLNARITHLRATTIATPGRAKDGVAEMQMILDAIATGDGAAAAAASVAHLNKAMHLALLQVRRTL